MDIGKTVRAVSVAGLIGLAGCASAGDFIVETGKALAEPLVRVGVEISKGNLLAPLYAPRGAVNTLDRLGHALTGNEYPSKVGEDGPIAAAIPEYILEGITAGIVFAPVVPLTYIEMGLIGGAAGGVGSYLKD